MKTFVDWCIICTMLGLFAIGVALGRSFDE